MREIKFRAWYKPKRVICKVTAVDWLYQKININYIPEGEDYEGYNDSWQNFVLMQFTGLKDKNGKEIYEDDIVIFQFYHVKRVGKVFYERGSFWLIDDPKAEPGTFGHQFLSRYRDSKLEVIGNIWETPSLWKGK